MQYGLSQRRKDSKELVWVVASVENRLVFFDYFWIIVACAMGLLQRHEESKELVWVGFQDFWGSHRKGHDVLVEFKLNLIIL